MSPSATNNALSPWRTTLWSSTSNTFVFGIEQVELLKDVWHSNQLSFTLGLNIWGKTRRQSSKTNTLVAIRFKCDKFQSLDRKEMTTMLNDQYILLAEDDSNDVLLIQRAFQKAGFGDVLKVVR